MLMLDSAGWAGPILATRGSAGCKQERLLASGAGVETVSIGFVFSISRIPTGCTAADDPHLRHFGQTWGWKPGPWGQSRQTPQSR